MSQSYSPLEPMPAEVDVAIDVDDPELEPLSSSTRSVMPLPPVIIASTPLPVARAVFVDEDSDVHAETLDDTDGSTKSLPARPGSTTELDLLRLGLKKRRLVSPRRIVFTMSLLAILTAIAAGAMILASPSAPRARLARTVVATASTLELTNPASSLVAAPSQPNAPAPVAVEAAPTKKLAAKSKTKPKTPAKAKAPRAKPKAKTAAKSPYAPD